MPVMPSACASGSRARQPGTPSGSAPTAATGVGLTGKSTIPKPGDGSLKLADGKRLKLDVTRSSARGSVPLRAGQVLAIVLPDHQLRGAARSRRTAGGGDSDFFIRAG